MPGIGLGVGIGRHRFYGDFAGAYSGRVIADGGVVESISCVASASSLLQSASLLLIPSGFKEDVLYAENPVNGNGDLTWTRASDAWRTNASGLVQRTPWNLLGYSEQFDNAYWTKINGASITSNSVNAPNGTLTADTLTVATSSFSGIGRAVTGSSGIYNANIYAKKNTKNWLYFIDVQGSNARAWFDLENGVLGTVSSGYSATITDVGNGWYRCALSNNTAQTLAYYQIGLADANNAITPTSSGSAYIWGAQLVEGSSAQTYFPTTDRLNVPRLSYMYGSCPAVLLEPQRTNLALRSEQFDDSTWAKTRCSITANSVVSPDGNTTADTLVEDTTASATHPVSQGVTLTAAAQTFSVYAKAANRSWMQIALLSTANASAYFNLSNGTVGTVGSAATASIVSVGNGWYRCVITATTAAGANTLGIYPASADATNVYTGNGTASIYIWGAQLEAGAYPTTYIQTTSASATRVADSFTRNNIYTNGLISSSGGTWFVELRGNLSLKGDSSGDGIFLQTIGNTDNFRLYSDNSVSSRIVIYKRVSNVNSAIYTTTTDTSKIAIKWNGSTADVFANGTKVVSATAFTATQLQDLTTSISAAPKFIQQMAIYSTPLSDTDCTTLTTL